MSMVSVNLPAPDFELADWKGNLVRLSGYRGQSSVLLVFNRGFI